jgi:NAD-dependent dihydropyrimidine dehydrogenase PreA subunit
MGEIGYARILALEPEKQIEKVASGLGESSITGYLLYNGKEIAYHAAPSCSIEEIISSTLGETNDLSEIMCVHVGEPLGVLLGADQLSTSVDAIGGFLYSYDLRILTKRDCILDYLELVIRKLQEISCGRCVMCREGCKHIRALLVAMMKGSAKMEDMTLLEELCNGILEGSYCSFGQGMSRLIVSGIETFREVFTAHVVRKRCDALICKEYITFHVLGTCTGCGECRNVCKEDAIEGREGMIHVIDNDICIKCGECQKICNTDAIVKASAVKPQVPAKPIPCGTWKR